VAYTLEQFSADCHRILTVDPGPEGRKKVCQLVQQACTDADFVRRHLPDDGPERHILYEDPQLGFCILGHVYHGAKQSAPHDHGPTWAIYGQAQGETIMTDWALVSPASETQIGKVSHVRDYTLKPGAAYVYNEGDLHSPRREGSTKLIRIEGRNVEKIRRYPYEKAA
jgi:predicted metal-dependent enzyme (double-stranded beta helix superfamily)